MGLILVICIVWLRSHGLFALRLRLNLTSWGVAAAIAQVVNAGSELPKERVIRSRPCGICHKSYDFAVTFALGCDLPKYPTSSVGDWSKWPAAKESAVDSSGALSPRTEM